MKRLIVFYLFIIPVNCFGQENKDTLNYFVNEVKYSDSDNHIKSINIYNCKKSLQKDGRYLENLSKKKYWYLFESSYGGYYFRNYLGDKVEDTSFKKLIIYNIYIDTVEIRRDIIEPQANYVTGEVELNKIYYSNKNVILRYIKDTLYSAAYFPSIPPRNPKTRSWQSSNKSSYEISEERKEIASNPYFYKISINDTTHLFIKTSPQGKCDSLVLKLKLVITLNDFLQVLQDRGYYHLIENQLQEKDKLKPRIIQPIKLEVIEQKIKEVKVGKKKLLKKKRK
jgi:hypothetical protein